MEIREAVTADIRAQRLAGLDSLQHVQIGL